MLNLRSGMGALAAILSGSVGAALAVPVLTPVVYHIEASNALGSGSYDFVLGDGSYLDAETYQLGPMPPVPIIDTGNSNVIAMLTGATLTAVDSVFGKQLSYSYSLDAFDGETTFRITTGTMSFGALSGQTGFASAALGVTDQTDPEDGAYHYGNGLLGKSHHSYYNGGTNFSRLVGDFNTVPGPGSNSIDMNENSGFLPIPGSVSSMYEELLFRVSGGDKASGNVTFAIIPEPATLGLLVLVGALAVRRR